VLYLLLLLLPVLHPLQPALLLLPPAYVLLLRCQGLKHQFLIAAIPHRRLACFLAG
jgi:hypothetical protein